MSSEEAGGCCGPLIGLWIMASLFGLFVYMVSDSSLETVENADLEEIIFYSLRPQTISESYKDRHKYLIEEMESKGLDTDAELLEMLEENRAIQSWRLTESPFPGAADMVVINLHLDVSSGDSFEDLGKRRYANYQFVVRKPQLTPRPKFAKLEGLISAEFVNEERSKVLDGPYGISKAIECLYHSNSMDSLIQSLK